MADVVRTLPVLTIGTTAVPLTTDTTHKWASVSIQSDFGNPSGSIVYVGDVNVSPIRYSRALRPGDYFVGSGSAVDPRFFWVVGTAAGLKIAISGT